MEKMSDHWALAGEDRLLNSVKRAEEVFWANPRLASVEGRPISDVLSLADIEDAEKRLERFAPYLEKVFPETSAPVLRRE